MTVPLNHLPPESRAWVYFSPIAWSDEQETALEEILSRFCESWTAHNKQLRAAYQLENRQFVVLAVDESMEGASGCSIDKSVAVMRQLSEAMGVDLLRKDLVPVWKQGAITVEPLSGLKSAVASGALSADTQVADLSVATLGAWQRSKQIPAHQTWMRRYFDQAISPVL